MMDKIPFINAELCARFFVDAPSPRKKNYDFYGKSVNGSFYIPATGWWYAIDAAPRKFAVSLLRNDITPLRQSRVFTLVYAFMHKGEEEADGKKKRRRRWETRLSGTSR